MVTIVNFKSFLKETGEKFFALEVQGGIEVVKSKQTGKSYLTAKTATLACTFNEETCKELIGTKLEGHVTKVPCEPYTYKVKETGEFIELNHRYDYVTEEDYVLVKNLLKTEHEVF